MWKNLDNEKAQIKKKIPICTSVEKVLRTWFSGWNVLKEIALWLNSFSIKKKCYKLWNFELHKPSSRLHFEEKKDWNDAFLFYSICEMKRNFNKISLIIILIIIKISVIKNELTSKMLVAFWWSDSHFLFDFK